MTTERMLELILLQELEEEFLNPYVIDNAEKSE